tara:strand:+ start:10064 stop:12145 length:2082 start_codon:yes stop_codon:yes gene_type:complete
MSFFKKQKIQLSEQQQEAVEFINEFAENQYDILIITGEAGSGKTETIKQIFSTNTKFENKYVSALSGRAAAVLRNKGITEATTIASLLYGKPNFSWERRNLNKEQKTKHRLKNLKGELFIFDEASMIPDFYSEEGGWSHKKEEVEIETIENLIKNKNKVVFVGDIYQLGPPISKRPFSYSHSNAVNPYFWEDKGFKVKTIDLDSTHRQKKDSQLLYFARGIISENSLIDPFYDQSVQKIETDEDVVSLYISEFKKNNEIKILSYLNEDVYRWNAKIREQLFDIIYKDNRQDNSEYRINENQFSEKVEKMVLENEVLMVTENNRYYDTELLNGDNILIEEIISKPYKGEIVESLPVKIFNKSGNATTEKFENFSLTFLDVKLKKVDASAYENQNLTAKIILETLETQKLKNNHIRNQRTNIIEAYLREDFEIRNKAAIEQILKGSDKYDQEEKLQNLYENDPFLNSLKVSYGYALTTHKAQGGEWEKIIADFESNLSHKDTRWAYTSITRAKKTIFMYKYPVVKSSSSPLNYVSPFKGFMDNLKSIFSAEKSKERPETVSSREKELELEIEKLKKELDKTKSETSNLADKPRFNTSYRKSKYEGPTNDEGLIDTDVAYKLKSWRLDKARNEGKPPFVILHNKHINSIAHFLPSNIEELAEIEGIGNFKISEYGQEILEIVNGENIEVFNIKDID